MQQKPGSEAHPLEIFETHGGILSTGQALKLGVPPRTLYDLRDQAKLERMERGLYRLADAKPLGNPDLVITALKVRAAALTIPNNGVRGAVAML